MIYVIYLFYILLFKALTVRPSCWNVLTPQCNVLVAVEDKLYVLDQFEAILQVHDICCMLYLQSNTTINIAVYAYQGFVGNFGRGREKYFVCVSRLYCKERKNIFKMNKEVGMLLPKKELGKINRYCEDIYYTSS